MKKHRYFLFAACAALAGCGLFLWMSSAVNRPFAHLDSADLASVTVRLSPPDKTLLIPEPGQLVEYLKDTVIYQRDDSYQDRPSPSPSPWLMAARPASWPSVPSL